MCVPHFDKVDKSKITASFSLDRSHRSSLTMPFFNRTENKTLCVIGQNPSYANEICADKTIHYLQHLIYDKHPEYGRILMLNLYSRIDTNKKETQGLLSLSAARTFRKFIDENDDFLVIYGKLCTSKKEVGYKFKKRATLLKTMLKNKNVFKIDIGTNYAPHPGNPKIYYGNYSCNFVHYDFSDI
jgi:hypothetical protein